MGASWRGCIGGLALTALFGVGLAFGQGEPEQQDNPYLLTFISWLPMIVLIGIWACFMRRMGLALRGYKAHRERSIAHMDAVEKTLDRIADILERRRQQGADAPEEQAVRS